MQRSVNSIPFWRSSAKTSQNTAFRPLTNLLPSHKDTIDDGNPIKMVSLVFLFVYVYNGLLLFGPTVHGMAMEYVAEQRCLFLPCSRPSYPPVVLLGGMAQSIPSWEAHAASMAPSRHVLVYEARGQGPSSPASLQNVTLPAQANYLRNTLDELDLTEVDLVGFSLGGRIALATSLLYPERVRKLHLTGVAVDRSPLGHWTVASWKDHVRNNDNLRSFAWSALLATYSPATLQYWRQKPDSLETVLNFVTAQNTKEGLMALLEQTHTMDDEWSVESMASRISHTIKGHACVGSLDHAMAPVSQVEKLCEALNWRAPTVLEGGGHAVPMEQPRQWRNDVMDFLNQKATLA
jgi:pimeloyl-ACP methyl ester carboxylesterase